MPFTIIFNILAVIVNNAFFMPASKESVNRIESGINI